MAATPQKSQPLWWPISWVGRLHQAFVFPRRTRVLSELLAGLLPPDAAVLDIGCGDGTIGNSIARLRPDVCVRGVEFLTRPGCQIECRSFDGSSLPFPDASFDVCLSVDVLHHTQDPNVLLREAARVSRSAVLLKDHLDENFIDNATLRFMDWVGNRPHGVGLTYNYQSRKRWEEHFLRCGLTVVHWSTEVPLYPPPFSLVLGRGLHFITLLKKMK
jgi:SAM-dependent methyltransferase